MVIWWLCWHRTILIRNITQKQYSQFPPVYDFGKPWWGVAYVPCMTNLRALCAWVIRWHVTCMLSLAEHWQGRRALSNHVCAHSVISIWHVVCLQHLARACSEQSRSTTVLPINHVIQMPQCLSGLVNHDYWDSGNLVHPSFTWFLSLNWHKSTFYCSRMPILFQNLTAVGLLWRHRDMGQPLAIVTSQWSIVPTGIYGRMMLRSAWFKGILGLTSLFTFLFIFGPQCFNTGHR